MDHVGLDFTASQTRRTDIQSVGTFHFHLGVTAPVYTQLWRKLFFCFVSQRLFSFFLFFAWSPSNYRALLLHLSPIGKILMNSATRLQITVILLKSRRWNFVTCRRRFENAHVWGAYDVGATKAGVCTPRHFRTAAVRSVPRRKSAAVLKVLLQSVRDLGREW